MIDRAQAEDKPMVETAKSREDLIREAAYQRYLARGMTEGDETTDWIEAEAQIDSQT